MISGLKLLLNRGYDSVGVSYIQNNEIATIKYASTAVNNSIELVEHDLMQQHLTDDSTVAIGHTRWSVFGPPTDINAHPHMDNRRRISICHNGMIENYQELKEELMRANYFFLSQTDTEVIAVMIGYYLDQKFDMITSIKKTLERLCGTYALTIIHCNCPHNIWVVRNGSPLLLGIEDDFVMVASEQIAFGNYIKKYIVLDNHDIIQISIDGNRIKYNTDIHRYNVNHSNAAAAPIETHPAGFKHWLMKEIVEQPESIMRAIGGRIENNTTVKLGGLDGCRARLMEINHIVLLGCGTSYNAGLWSTHLFKSLEIFDTVSVYDGAEFSMKDIPRRGKTGVVLISQSGETKDLHRCIQIVKDFDIITIGVINVVDSMIARETDCGVYLNAGREVAVASTKSFTNQCIVLSMIAVWFSQNRDNCIVKRGKIIKDLRNISFQMQDLIQSTRIIESNTLMNATTLFVLGKNQSHAIALEGSLKIKEVCYIHAEGYSSGALKHGPLALIEHGTPVVLLDIDDDYREKNMTCYHEMKARGADIIHITDLENNFLTGASPPLKQYLIPHNKTFGCLLANCIMQMMSYYIAIERNLSPDFPRNLAKVVTVE